MDLHERDVGLDRPVSFTQLQVCFRICRGAGSCYSVFGGAGTRGISTTVVTHAVIGHRTDSTVLYALVTTVMNNSASNIASTVQQKCVQYRIVASLTVCRRIP